MAFVWLKCVRISDRRVGKGVGGGTGGVGMIKIMICAIT